MSRLRGDVWLWAGVALVVVPAAGVLILLFAVPNRDSLGTLIDAIGTVVALAATAVNPLYRRWRQSRETNGVLPLEQAADELAERVRAQWETAASHRRLRHPAPISVRWATPAVVVAGPLSDALGEGVTARRLAPLDGLSPVTAASLAAGDVSELFAIYGGLASGRLVVVGGQGAGKSAAAIRLVLSALEHRKSLERAGRATVPVPVIFSPEGWDPTSQRVEDWLADRLAADYPLLRAREYGRDTAMRLIRNGHVALVVDGLDDVAEPTRSTVLEALDEQVTFRLVVLSSSAEMATAAADRHLSGAVAVELQPVQACHAADYLARCQLQPLAPAWQNLTESVREDPAGPAAQALDSPLMLTLVRDTYKNSDHVDELLDSDRFPTREAVEAHLLHRVLPRAYSPTADRRGSRYTLAQAEQWLGYLAYRMSKDSTRSFAWWSVSDWTPRWQRFGAPFVACSLLAGILLGIVGAFEGKPLAGFAAGVLFGSNAVIFDAFFVSRDQLAEWRAIALPTSLGYLLGTIYAAVLAGSLLAGTEGATAGFLAGSLVGLTVGMPGTLLLTVRLPRPTARASSSPLNPVALWRQEWPQNIALSILLGVTVGLALGTTSALLDKPSGVSVGLALLGLTIMPSFASSLSAAARTAFATLQLRRSGCCSFRIIRFLEDAKEQGIMRTAGPVYQFRHARLQETLARSFAEREVRETNASPSENGARRTRH